MSNINICKGFGTEYACGKCMISMSIHSLNYLSLVQVTDLLITVTRKVKVSELPIVASFSDCFTSCRPGDVRYSKIGLPSLGLGYYVDLVTTTMSLWKSTVPQSHVNKMSNDDRRDIAMRDYYSNRLSGTSDVENMLQCLKDMGTGASERTGTITSEYMSIAMATCRK